MRSPFSRSRLISINLMPPALPAACSGLGAPRTITDVLADGEPWTIAPARVAALAASARGLVRMPVNARWTPFSVAYPAGGEGRRLAPQRGDQLVGALVAFPALADAAVDDLLQIVATGEPPHVGRTDARLGVALDQHREELAHLVDVVAGLPFRHQAGDHLAGRRQRVHRPRGDAAVVALLSHDPEVAQLERRAVADEHVERREIPVQQLPAMQLAEHLEDPGDLAAGPRLAPRAFGARQEAAEIAVGGVLEGQGVEHAAVASQHRETVEHLDRPGMLVEQLPEVRLPEPGVEPGTDLETDLGRHPGGATDSARQIDLAEAALANQTAYPVGMSGVRIGHDLVGRQQGGGASGAVVDTGPGRGRRDRRPESGRLTSAHDAQV